MEDCQLYLSTEPPFSWQGYDLLELSWNFEMHRVTFRLTEYRFCKKTVELRVYDGEPSPTALWSCETIIVSAQLNFNSHELCLELDDAFLTCAFEKEDGFWFVLAVEKPKLLLFKLPQLGQSFLIAVLPNTKVITPYPIFIDCHPNKRICAKSKYCNMLYCNSTNKYFRLKVNTAIFTPIIKQVFPQNRIASNTYLLFYCTSCFNFKLSPRKQY